MQRVSGASNVTARGSARSLLIVSSVVDRAPIVTRVHNLRRARRTKRPSAAGTMPPRTGRNLQNLTGRGRRNARQACAAPGKLKNRPLWRLNSLYRSGLNLCEAQTRHTRSDSRRRSSNRRRGGHVAVALLQDRAVGRGAEVLLTSATTATTWPAIGPSTRCPPTESPKMRKRGKRRSASCAAASCPPREGSVPTVRPWLDWHRGSPARSMRPPSLRPVVSRCAA